MQTRKEETTTPVVTVGIDGITCIVSRNIVQVETLLPTEENYFLKLTPKGSCTEVATILPKTLRANNNIGFRCTDIKRLGEVIQQITRQLKQYQKDLTHCEVTQIEVALTVDFGNYDSVTMNTLLNLYSNTLLVKEHKTDGINKMSCKPQQQYVCGRQLKTNYYFLMKKVIKSFITDTWSNKRLKFKCYSKSAGSVFGGDTSVFRLEILYNERGIRNALHFDGTKTVTLQDILKERALKSLIQAFKIDYREIVVPRIQGYLNESERLVFEKLHSMSAYNALLVCIPFIPDINVYKKALHRYYVEQGKSEETFRKMLSRVTKRLREEEEIEVSDKVLTILRLIGKHTKY